MRRPLTICHHRWIVGYRVEVPAYWDDVPPEVHSRVYNGCGPDWFPAWLRSALTWLSAFPVPAMVHDVEWATNKSWASLVASNRRWWRNCGAVIRASVRDLPPDLAVVVCIHWTARRLTYTAAVWCGAVLLMIGRRLGRLGRRK